MMLPSEEEGVLAGLKPKNIPIKKLTINPEKVGDGVSLVLACFRVDPVLYLGGNQISLRIRGAI